VRPFGEIQADVLYVNVVEVCEGNFGRLFDVACYGAVDTASGVYSSRAVIWEASSMMIVAA